MADETGIFIGATADGQPQSLNLRRANRHGLIAGATGTGKTVTLQGIAEGFSARRRAGVPRRREGRSRRHRHGRLADRQDARRCWAARAAEIGETDWAYADNPVDVLGSVRRAGPPDPHHRLRDGAAAAGAADGAERGAGRRARRSPSASPTSRGCCCSTSPICRRCWRIAPQNAAELTTRYGNVSQAERRRDPAAAAPARSAGRRRLLRRAGARHPRFHRRRRSGPRLWSTSSPPTS